MTDQAGDHLMWLTRWYAAQCDGDWEHSYGVEIQTLDNPGWLFKVDLTDTNLAGKPFATFAVNMEASAGAPAASWYHCAVEGGQFQAVGGAHDLMTLLGIFRAWAERPQR